MLNEIIARTHHKKEKETTIMQISSFFSQFFYQYKLQPLKRILEKNSLYGSKPEEDNRWELQELFNSLLHVKTKPV